MTISATARAKAKFVYVKNRVLVVFNLRLFQKSKKLTSRDSVVGCKPSILFKFSSGKEEDKTNEEKVVPSCHKSTK